MKLNKERVEQLQSGKVVLYTGDKKGSDVIHEVLKQADVFYETCNIKKSTAHFYGTNDVYELGIINLHYNELNNRPIHPIEWFYEEEAITSITFHLSDSNGKEAKFNMNAKKVIELCSDDVYEMIEQPCNSGTCYTESQNFCDCPPEFDNLTIKRITNN